MEPYNHAGIGWLTTGKNRADIGIALKVGIIQIGPTLIAMDMVIHNNGKFISSPLLIEHTIST